MHIKNIICDGLELLFYWLVVNGYKTCFNIKLFFSELKQNITIYLLFFRKNI